MVELQAESFGKLHLAGCCWWDHGVIPQVGQWDPVRNFLAPAHGGDELNFWFLSLKGGEADSAKKPV